jgi:tetratricopeptide (TPR) repeat protein
MRRFGKHPRRNTILLIYLFILLSSVFIPWLNALRLLAALLALSLLLILIFLPDSLAVAANLMYIRGEYDKAARLFGFVTKHKTISPQAHLNYAVYLIRNGRAAEAEGLLGRALALALDSQNIMTQKNARLTQASCKYALGDTDGAIDILERMRADFDYVNDRVLSTLGFMYFLKGDLEKAEAFSKDAIAENGESHPAWDNLGQIYLKRGQTAEAKEAFKKALEYKSDLPDSLYHLGLIEKSESNGEAAKEYLEKAAGCEITALNTVTRGQIEEALRSLQSV